MNDSWIYGGRGPAPRTVVVYGNCQAPYLARLLAAIDDWNDDYRFVFAPNHAMPGEPHPRPVDAALLSDVALVLLQHEERSNAAAAALRAGVAASTPVIRFPSYYLQCLWPFECPEPRAVPEPGYAWSRYPLGDMIGLEIAQQGLRGPLAVAAYMDLSMRKMPDLQVRLERDIAHIRRYDTACDVQLGDYVESNFRHQHLFWTNGHMARTAVCELARRVAAAVRPVLGGTSERAAHCIEAAADFEGMGEQQLPIHPLVASAYGLAYCEPDRTWRWYDQAWSYFEYLERYIGWDTSWGVQPAAVNPPSANTSRTNPPASAAR